MGTEISQTRAPRSYLSVHIFLSPSVLVAKLFIRVTGGFLSSVAAEDRAGMSVGYSEFNFSLPINFARRA